MKNGKVVRKVMNRRYIAYSDKLFEIIFVYLGKFLYFCSEKNINKISIYGNTVQKAPNVYFPGEDGYCGDELLNHSFI